MRKAIGIVNLITGILYMLFGLGYAILFGIIAAGMGYELSYTSYWSPEYAGLEVGMWMMIIYAVLFLLLFGALGIMQVINGALAFTKMKDKTFGIVSVIFGALTSNTITLILGIIILVKVSETDKVPAVENAIDTEIETLKKQIELAKLKEAEKLANAEKYKELDRLKIELAQLNK